MDRWCCFSFLKNQRRIWINNALLSFWSFTKNHKMKQFPLLHLLWFNVSAKIRTNYHPKNGLYSPEQIFCWSLSSTSTSGRLYIYSTWSTFSALSSHFTVGMIAVSQNPIAPAVYSPLPDWSKWRYFCSTRFRLHSGRCSAARCFRVKGSYRQSTSDKGLRTPQSTKR